MKKSTKKIINHLKPFIGHEIIRTIPVSNDANFTSYPVLLVGFTSNGCIRCRGTVHPSSILSENTEYVLPLLFTDRNWITYKKALRSKNNRLNEWKGKKIRRIHPTSFCEDYSYMDSKGVLLISASKHHLLIKNKSHFCNETTRVLNFDFANPEDWILAE